MTVAVQTDACLCTYQIDQGISCSFGTGVRTGLVSIAGSIHLTRCNTGKAHMWPLSAPDRAVTIPNMGWCAQKGLACRYDGNRRKAG